MSKTLRKRLVCKLFGHSWVSDFDPKEEIEKPLKDRVYCKRCRVRYHVHEYKN